MATEHTNLSAFDPDEFRGIGSLRIGLVTSQWNGGITDSLRSGAKETLIKAGIKHDHIFDWKVPGSFELIHGCKRMHQMHDPDAIIAIGSLIQGETRHFEFVSSAVAHGIVELNVRLTSPVIFCVLTDDHIEQARERSGGKHGNKGVEAAVAALRMARLGT